MSVGAYPGPSVPPEPASRQSRREIGLMHPFRVRTMRFGVGARGAAVTLASEWPGNVATNAFDIEPFLTLLFGPQPPQDTVRRDEPTDH